MVSVRVELDREHQITIPSSIRQHLQLRIGDIVCFTIEEGRVVLTSDKNTRTESTRGLGDEMWREAGGGAAAIEAERDSWD